MVSVSGIWGRRRRYKPHCSSSVRSGYTEWHKEFTFQCKDVYQSIREIRSIHSNCKEDRSWYFKCAYNAAAGHSCDWTEWANDHDNLLNFHCPHEGYVTGIRAIYDGSKRDRRFKFRCCHGSDGKFIRRDCRSTHFENVWDGELHYVVPENYYLTAVTSIHDNKKEDRRWQFEVCKKFSTASCDYKREVEEDFKLIEKRKLEENH